MPKFAIFTPTHNATFLMDVYRSLKQQTFKSWCWVLVPNGSVVIPEPIRKDPKVRIVPWSSHMQMMHSTNIGALKYFACQHIIAHNLGDILVELDHDDYLLDVCLSFIAKASKKYPKAGFFYSDCIGVTDTGTSETFSPYWGWDSYEKELNNKTWTVMRTFPVTARSLAEIYYCPNHVRAWTREAYIKSGGHSPHMEVADDHDLLCRTYLNQIEFCYIAEPLYVYQRHKNATAITKNALIQEQQAQVCHKYLFPLAKEWCRREGLAMYDLGGAHNPEPGFVTVDKCDAHIIHDILTGPWAEENSAGIIRCADFIEHIPIPSVVPFVNNVYRQLAPGGWWLTSTPSTDGRGAFCDPTHVSFWNELSFRYYTDPQYAKYVPEITAKFQQMRLFTSKPTPWHEQNNVPYVISDMCAMKGQRQPGPNVW